MMKAIRLKKMVSLGVPFFLLIIIGFPAQAAIPRTVDYQGYLTNAQGAPVNGSVDMVFSLWDSLSGGNELWNESAASVSVNSGVFQVVLGNVTLLPDGLFSNPLFLEIRAGGETLSPRKTLSSTPYALRAGRVDLDNFTLLGPSCSSGQVPKWSGAAWTCADDLAGAGDITAVAAGQGLTGGGPSGDVTLSADPSYLQRRVGGSCAPGSSIRAVDESGAVTCQADTNSGGTVTQVNSGPGLAGGPITGAGTLSVVFAGIGSAQTASRSDHHHDILYQKKYGKTAVVALSGADYTDPIAALADRAAWCGTPSAGNPCLLKIMPGEYDLKTSSLAMQPYIDIEGSGENATRIKGNPSAQGVVTGADNAEIRFLSIEHVGGVTLARGFYNNTASPKLYRLTIRVSGGTSASFGVYNGSSSPQITHVTISAAGPAVSYGIYNDVSAPILKNLNVSSAGGTFTAGIESVESSFSMEDSVVAASGTQTNVAVDFGSSIISLKGLALTASGGSNTNYCLQIAAATTANVFNSTCTASGSGTNIGVSNSNSSIILTNVVMEAKEGGNNHGIWNYSNSGLKIIKVNHSVIKASTYTIYNPTDCSTYVGNSQLDGGNTANLGTLVCAGVYDENYQFFPGPGCP